MEQGIILQSARTVRLGVPRDKKINCPQIDQKSPLASPSYHDESCREVEEDPSDSPRRLSSSSPVSGLCRIKVDVLRSRSPESLTVPSSIGI